MAESTLWWLATGGLVAVVLANVVSYFLVRIVGKNLEG